MNALRFNLTNFLTAAVWCAVSILCLASVNATAAQLSGSITLPAGSSAGSGGARFTIRTQPSLGVDARVAIPAGQSSTNFILNLPNGASYRVRFDCTRGCGDLDVTTAGFWNQANGVVGLEGDATAYASAQPQSVDIQLESADMFSGVIQLPEGFTAQGGESIRATVTAAVFGNAAVFTQVIRAREGDTSWPFAIGAPAKDTGGGWNFDVQCDGCDADVAPGRYFPTTVTGDPAVLEQASRFFFLKNRDNLGMQMSFISIAPPEPEKTTAIAPILLLLDD